MWASIQEAITQLVGTSFGSMSFGERLLYLIAKYGPSYLAGAGNTMLIAVVSTAIGCIIGFAVGIVQTIPLTNRDNLFKRIIVKFCQILLTIYVEVFRGTPMMIQAVFLYYGTAQLFNIYMGTWAAAFFIVSINTGAYMAETVRGGILSVDPGQTEGAKAIGMTHVQTMLHVILPQTLRNIMPQIGNNLIINIKDTCVLSVISVVELFFTHKGVAGALYGYFESATITMAIYLTLTLICSRLLRWVEKKMDGDDNYDLATTDTLAHTSGMIKFHGRKHSSKKASLAEAETAERGR
jgi:His/Glu/Gln/Arg/opine family amino acid ABC transporter permease subunit